jgi:cob(I)alamin adenosyltransferase
MKIYTRTGDSGTTGLFGGDRVTKTHPRIAAYGTVDELNAFVGMARAHFGEAEAPLDAISARVQNDLFVIGADLATPATAKPSVPRVEARHVEALERDIDALEAELEPLKQFVLPGGTPSAAALHLARTVCRRAERESVDLAATEPINEHVATYLNRLSDLFFVMSRWANHERGVSDVPWVPEKKHESTDG